MSELKVEVVKIDAINPHPNAQRLELAQVKGWQSVVGLHDFEAGDLAIYFPIDSILPESLEAKIFGPDSKIKLSNHRVKTIKIRGAISQGLLVHPNEFRLGGLVEEGDDLTEKLGVTKYEPPVKLGPQSGLRQRSPLEENPHFIRYTDIEKWQNYPSLFEVGEYVVITEKIHGTNFRAGWVPTVANTTWKKVLKFVGLLPKYEFVYGSHRVQLQNRKYKNNTFHRQTTGTNIYEECVDKYDLKNRIPKGCILFGEVYGSGIQKGYTYGCVNGERRAVFFDLFRAEAGGMGNCPHYFNESVLNHFIVDSGLPYPPVLYRGPLYSFDTIKDGLISGCSKLHNSQLVKEGIVIRPQTEQHTHAGRKILKYINPEYLLRPESEETEFH